MVNLTGDFDLNEGLNFNNWYNLSVDCEGNAVRRNFIDLNLNVNGNFDESSKMGDFGWLVDFNPQLRNICIKEILGF